MTHTSEIERRRIVDNMEERIGNVASKEYPGIYPGEDHSWNLEKFQAGLRLETQRLTPSSIEFDLIGVDASIANSLRRTLIAEVPTIAIESVYVYNNTSIMQDEVLAHRLGLLPIKFDPRLLNWKPKQVTGADGSGLDLKPTEDETVTDRNTIVFTLAVECSRNPTAARDETDPAKLYINSSVYSGHLAYQHHGRQYRLFNLPIPPPATADENPIVDPDHEMKGDSWSEPPKVSVDDVLLVKMRPGQQLNMLLYAVKGVGKDHAKFSPVATASYRLLPHIDILSPIPPEHAAKFQACFPPGVVDLEYDDETGEQTKVVVKNPRLDTVSREVLRYPEFRDRVKLGRVRDHFIYSIESTGAYKPQELLPEAIKIMLDKLDSVEHCMRVKFPGLVPASKEMQVDPEEAFANEGRVPKGRGAGRKARK
ncbi:hypothetical protein FFLO_02776 [Filobasidium floriforme]|uniref:DNA-directed RNA polymerases I and III subunit RPAC1 n=1 Tax=Filobasidium floriforme TaxID=5210 RepID=A0A8K0JMN0_9TREE|nr:DNA-directed RNA polymerase [Filobasidium floriforme]KAG7558306.1 hypothetical protein FFLO_02776 [Filobasidium floriforme]KAH8087953.1 DNA-directed RNA polymerase [Filobasidium floriforme]